MRMHTVHINRVRADTSLARRSALVKQCGLAGPRLASFRGQLDMLGIEALAAGLLLSVPTRGATAHRVFGTNCRFDP